MAGKRTKKTERKNKKSQHVRRQRIQRIEQEYNDPTMGGEYVPLTADTATEHIRQLCPITRVNGVIQSPREADALRKFFMVWDEGWRERTDRSARFGLNDIPSTNSIQIGSLTVPTYTILGYASKTHTFSDGTDRLMLSAPFSINNDNEIQVIDDHLWLDLASCSRPFENGNASIYYGDLVCIAATIEPYGEDGERRLGVKYWTIRYSHLDYFDDYANKLRALPHIFGTDALLVRYAYQDGQLCYQMAPEERLEKYLLHLAHDFDDVDNTIYAHKAAIAKEITSSSTPGLKSGA